MTVYTKTTFPHISSDKSVASIYWSRTLLLVPILSLSLLIFGWDAARLIFAAVLGSVLAEWGGAILMERNLKLSNGNSLWTALFYVALLPPNTPTFFAFVSMFLATMFVREILGGMGTNFFDPSLFARVGVGLYFQADSYRDIYPLNYSWITRGLSFMKNDLFGFFPNFGASFLGTMSYDLGTISGLLIFILGGWILFKKWVRFETPFIYLLSAAIIGKYFHGESIWIIFSPQVLFVAFFFFLDPVCTPCTRIGMRWFVFGVSILSAWGGFSGDYFLRSALAVLIMSFFVPWLDIWFRPKGVQKK